MSIHQSYYDSLVQFGKKLELYTQPFHPIENYRTKNLIAGVLLNGVKISLWGGAIFHVFDAGFRHSVRNILQIPLHPLLPLLTLVSTLSLGILLQGIGESYAIAKSQRKPHKKSHNVPAEYIKHSNLKVTKVRVHIPKNFQLDNFKKFLLNSAPSSKKRLLEETVLKKTKLFTKKYPGHNLYYRKVTLDLKKFIKLTKDNSITSKSKVDVDPDWYDYRDEGGFYVLFANAETPGGGYRKSGNVMEEVAWEEIPTLPLLDYLVRKDHSLLLPTLNGRAYPDDEAAPYVVQNIRRHVVTSPKLYGSGYTKMKPNQLEKHISVLQKPSSRFHAISIAAQCWKGQPKKRYDMDSLLYHLQASYLGYMGAKKTHEDLGYESPQPCVHTGALGCGVFGNSEKMMISIQILAARMSGVNLVFHGIGHKGNPGYSEKMIRTQEKYIDGLLNNGITPYRILKELMNQQTSDKSIRPK